MSTIILTGYGRSGTKFLTEVFSKSKTSEVYHEPRGSNDEKNKNLGYSKFINSFFASQKKPYIEINSYLRFHYDYLSCKKGFIIRNPYDIFLSVLCRKPQSLWNQCYENFRYDIVKIYNTIMKGSSPYFIFEKFTSKDLKVQFAELTNISNFLEINDLDIKNIIFNSNLDPVNSTEKIYKVKNAWSDFFLKFEKENKDLEKAYMEICNKRNKYNTANII